MIKPAARRQPGGGRVADVSIAQYEDEDAFAAASGSATTIFSYEQVMQQSSCWNCRGLGHVREACPSSTGKQAVGHAVSALQSLPSYSGSKGKGKGGRGAGKGKGRARWPRQGRCCVLCGG